MSSLSRPHPARSDVPAARKGAARATEAREDRVAEVLRLLGGLTGLHPVSTGMEPGGDVLLHGERALSEIRERLGAELRWEHDRARTLELVARNEPQDAVLDSVLQMVVHQEPAAAAIFTLDETELRLAAACGLPEGLTVRFRTEPPEATSPALAPALLGEPVFTGSVSRLPNLDPFRESLLVHGLHSCAAWPAVSADGTVLALLLLFAAREGTPGADVRAMMESAVRTAALALENRRTYTALAYQAQHDTLTSLPNRLCFHDLTRQAVGSARRRGHRLALIRVDLDNFKHVNDLFGHRGGDSLLREVARRLRSTVRAADSVARMGGDEFAILLHEVDGPEGAMQAARKIRALLSAPVPFEGAEISVTGSVGVSLFPDHATDAESLLCRADEALDAARARGRDCCHVFTPGTSTGAHERIAMEFQLRRALEQNQFHLVYQPQFSASTHRITGVEALLRWDNPSVGLIPPDRFIPMAESLGVIVPIGRWALEEACRQAARWAAMGHRLRMAVNVSAVQFAQANFTQSVLEVVGYTGIDPSMLELELTESCLLCDPTLVRSQMDALRAAGIRLSLDDFGTGYSSLSYLHRLPVDALKIDRSFIRDLGTDSANARLVEAVVRLAQSLHLTVVAEGVENQAQLAVLSDLGCEYVQGFLFERPLRPDSIERLLVDDR